MPRESNKRDRLVAAADDLIYKQGYHRTTLADVATVSGVPLGNVYYYFKTKEELGTAVVELRTEQFNADTERWEAIEPDPRERLVLFLKCHLDKRDMLARYGCPIGSLTQELDKLPSRLSEKADWTLRAQLQWVGKQFRSAGSKEPERQAEHLFARLQGAIVLASATRDPGVIGREIEAIGDWLAKLPRQSGHKRH